MEKSARMRSTEIVNLSALDGSVANAPARVGSASAARSMARRTDFSVLLLTPMFVPLASAVGMDTIQLGIMMIVNLSIGLYHPPIGTTLFITSSIAKVRIGDVVIELIPFYAVAIALLLGFAYLPWLTLR